MKRIIGALLMVLSLILIVICVVCIPSAANGTEVATFIILIVASAFNFATGVMTATSD